MDYDLKILYPVKISLYKDKKKKKKKAFWETHSGLEILHPCTLRKVVNKVLKKTIPAKISAWKMTKITEKKKKRW